MGELREMNAAMARLCHDLDVRFAVQDLGEVRNTIAADGATRVPLTPRERELYAGCRILKRRTDWLAGRLAAKRAVAALLSMTPEQIEIDRLDGGAPFATGCSQAHLSISHSGGMAVAVAARFPVGIDLEQDEPRCDALVRAVLCPHERRLVDGRPAEHRRREFNRLWTCKEAVAKVGGWGGTKDFKAIDCSQDLTEVEAIPIRHRSLHTPSYVVTLAYAAGQGGHHG